MKRWAVSYISFSDNDLTTVVVSADDWFGALGQHPKLQGDADQTEWLNEMRLLDIESVKQEFFNGDAMVDCVEIPDSFVAISQPERITKS